MPGHHAAIHKGDLWANAIYGRPDDLRSDKVFDIGQQLAVRDHVKEFGAAVAAAAFARQRFHNFRTLVPNARQSTLEGLFLVGSAQLPFVD